MEIKPKCHNKVTQLINKGVNIPNPLTLDIGDEVNSDQISAHGVTIYPGCRIYGEKTLISADSTIGYEGPVTIENCQIGPKVELKGGYFSKSIFFEKVSLALGAHVREGCILEEEANGAHCVGIKQTILFPFVTLGSLINFCDCLMAGGTSRQNHSEVGSSYIHFNFTPDGYKTTPSLIGDVPKGVMLNQPPIFLGGQGGMVGPLRIGYGNIVAAGSILRNDYLVENKLIIGKTHTGTMIDFVPGVQPSLFHILENNICYLANLIALEQWYRHVRKSFFDAQEFGELFYTGLLDKLALAKKERLQRLTARADKEAVFSEKENREKPFSADRREFHDNIKKIEALFKEGMLDGSTDKYRDLFLSEFHKNKSSNQKNYIEVIQGLPADVSEKGTLWLDKIVENLCMRAAALMPA